MLNKKELLKKGKRVLYYSVLIAVSSLIIYFVLTVQAGNFNPTSPVSSTMRSLDEIYAVLFGTYDSSGISGKSDGNASEMLKCITDKMNGGVCD